MIPTTEQSPTKLPVLHIWPRYHFAKCPTRFQEIFWHFEACRHNLQSCEVTCWQWKTVMGVVWVLCLTNHRADVLAAGWTLTQLTGAGQSHPLDRNYDCQWCPPQSGAWATQISSTFNSISPSAAYMRQWTGSALVQIMAFSLFSAKPLSKQMLDYHQLNP